MFPMMPFPAQIEYEPGTLAINSEFRVGLSGQVEPRLERVMLSNVAAIGLLSLRALHNKRSISRSELNRYRAVLEQTTTPIAELQLMITPGAQKLVEAISTEVRDGPSSQTTRTKSDGSA